METLRTGDYLIAVHAEGDRKDVAEKIFKSEGSEEGCGESLNLTNNN